MSSAPHRSPRRGAGWACAVALLVGCSQHDTIVAIYRPPVVAGAGSGTAGGGGTSSGGEAGQLPSASGAAGDSAGGEGGAAPVPRCWDAYTTVVEGLTSHYKVVTAGQPWPVAERDCEADGAHLVIVDDATEETYLTSLAKQNTTDNGSTNELVWLGLSDQTVEGTFEWVTGLPLTLSHWSGGEPNNSFGGIEDCVEIRGSGDWNDDHCSAHLAYVCECDGTVSAARWCDTDLPATCGDCSTTCSEAQSCVTQKCE